MKKSNYDQNSPNREKMGKSKKMGNKNSWHDGAKKITGKGKKEC